MKIEKLDYYLPPELIAQQPIEVRSDSRLLVLDRSVGELTDSRFNRIGRFLSSGDCLVLNDTKVMPARFFARRGSGGKLEGLFLSQSGQGVWIVHLKGARRVKVGETIYLRSKEKGQKSGYRAVVLDKTDRGRCSLKLETDGSCEAILEQIGFPPLPPYIRRDDDPAVAAVDKLRYQTVYAQKVGAIAAPTAGLHFTDELIGQLIRAGINFAYTTLHVGAGTFQPVTTQTLEEHEMQQEQFCIDEENARIINQAKEKGERVIAVGTTSVRALETAADGCHVRADSGKTQLFIKPGYKFKIVDAMLTNFHLPRSTLLALVSAYAGMDKILTAYQHAIELRYRFYSYGDAMLII